MASNPLFSALYFPWWCAHYLVFALHFQLGKILTSGTNIQSQPFPNEQTVILGLVWCFFLFSLNTVPSLRFHACYYLHLGFHKVWLKPWTLKPASLHLYPNCATSGSVLHLKCLPCWLIFTGIMTVLSPGSDYDNENNLLLRMVPTA